jgi:hypothetical protein
MYRRRLIIALFFASIAFTGADLAIRKAFGVFLPWQVPERIDVCGSRYHPSGLNLQPDADTIVVQLRATFFDLPIPLPDLQPTDPGLPYRGCPIELQLLIGDGVIGYGPPEGGP